MTQYDDITMKYTAGIKLSATMKAATIVLLESAGSDIKVVGCETLICSNNLREVWKWLDHNTAGNPVTTVAGVESSMLRFLDIRIPAVDYKQQYSLIQTQAEAVLPLSADQMVLAWQTEPDTKEGLLCRTAAARKELLGPVLAKTDRIQAAIPEAAGLATAWKRFGRNAEQQCILLHRRKSDFLAAMLQDGHLQRSTVIDAEGADLQEGLPAGLLVQDILAAVDSMGAGCEQKPPLCILSENAQDEFLDSLCTQVQNAGWKAEIAFLEDFSGCNCGDEALEAFGLALTAITPESIDFDFRRADILNQPDETHASAATQLRNAIAITIALLVIGLGISYWSIRKDVKILNEIMAFSHGELTVEQVLEEKAYREKVARARPDMMDLFGRIQKSRGNILLDSLEFEKGKPVKISAIAESFNAAYTFQKELEAQNPKMFTKATLLEPHRDKNGKVAFSISFYYRHFSE